MREAEILNRLAELYKQSRDLRNRQYEAAMCCECWSKKVRELSKEIEKVDEELHYLNTMLATIWRNL